jgi:DNA-binding CsgD family transcriptional regulator
LSASLVWSHHGGAGTGPAVSPACVHLAATEPPKRGGPRRGSRVYRSGMTTTASGRRLVASIQRSGERTATVDDFFTEVSAEVEKVVPFDGSMWFGVDPSTLLALSPARIHNMDSSLCWPFWLGEFHDNDLLQFRDLARQPVPVDSLRSATGGLPVRSPRYRDFLTPQGYDDEARVAFRTGSTTWAVAGLYREKGRPAFDGGELRLLGDISEAVGAVLRSRSVVASPLAGSLIAPGVLMFGADGVLLSANQEAKAWLAELYGPEADGVPWTELLARCAMSDRLLPYTLMQPLVARARAVAIGHDEGPVRVRLRDRGGRWVVLHASCLAATDADGPVVVVVEPAKSAEVAPIVVEAYGLTAREREVVRRVASGMSTPEIAAALYLSGHTVRDYIKSVFEKVGVSSRAELIAKLFAEHYADALHADAVHIDT